MATSRPARGAWTSSPTCDAGPSPWPDLPAYQPVCGKSRVVGAGAWHIGCVSRPCRPPSTLGLGGSLGEGSPVAGREEWAVAGSGAAERVPGGPAGGAGVWGLLAAVHLRGVLGSVCSLYLPSWSVRNVSPGPGRAHGFCPLSQGSLWPSSPSSAPGCAVILGVSPATPAWGGEHPWSAAPMGALPRGGVGAGHSPAALRNFQGAAAGSAWVRWWGSGWIGFI